MANISLFYEILLYLNSFYFGMFAVCEVGMSAIKYVNRDYDTGTMLWEFGLLLFLIVCETLRIFLGRKGNLSERAFPVLLSVFLIFPSSLPVVYFIAKQAYILRFEYILCGLMLILHAVELISAVLSFLPFMKPRMF